MLYPILLKANMFNLTRSNYSLVILFLIIMYVQIHLVNLVIAGAIWLARHLPRVAAANRTSIQEEQ